MLGVSCNFCNLFFHNLINYSWAEDVKTVQYFRFVNPYTIVLSSEIPVLSSVSNVSSFKKFV